MLQTLIYCILHLESVMSIIHEWELENMDSIDLNQRNVRRKPSKQNSYSCSPCKLAWVPGHRFKIKAGKTIDENQKHKVQDLPK